MSDFKKCKVCRDTVYIPSKGPWKHDCPGFDLAQAVEPPFTTSETLKGSGVEARDEFVEGVGCIGRKITEPDESFVADSTDNDTYTFKAIPDAVLENGSLLDFKFMKYDGIKIYETAPQRYVAAPFDHTYRKPWGILDTESVRPERVAISCDCRATRDGLLKKLNQGDVGDLLKMLSNTTKDLLVARQQISYADMMKRGYNA
jgi:hypothetical protein